MGLAHQVGNKVTLSYRKGSCRRIKERNSQRIAEAIRARKIDVLFNSMPTGFRSDSVVPDVASQARELPNDFAWIFAGGEPPTAFLKKIGVGFGAADLTSQSGKEVKQARELALQLTH